MNIEIKKSTKPVNYKKAINLLEERVQNLTSNNEKELIWFLEHRSIFTAGTSYKEKEIVEKSIKIFKTNRGGKITWHGPGQKIFYFVINLSKRKKDIRKFINVIEKIVIDTLKEYKIKSFADRKNIGIWVKKNGKIEKVAAIGVKIKKWIAYHGCSININNDLSRYDKIIPCGIKNRGITNLYKIKKQNFKNFEKILVKNFLKNLKS